MAGSLQRRLDVFVFSRGELVLGNHPSASIPAEDCIIVSGRSKRCGFLEPVHGLAETFVGLVVATRRAAGELRFSASLRQYSAVIGALVFAFDSGQNLFRLSVANTITFAKTVGQREQERGQRLLIFRLCR